MDTIMESMKKKREISTHPLHLVLSEIAEYKLRKYELPDLVGEPIDKLNNLFGMPIEIDSKMGGGFMIVEREVVK
tara:strand:+ start:104 stop:328 length:225 start_codon:yes stop_codon:yes gene_type:complete